MTIINFSMMTKERSHMMMMKERFAFELTDLILNLLLVLYNKANIYEHLYLL